MNIVIDCGVSADDLASETLEKFLASPNGLGWKKSKGPLVVFLRSVLHNVFLDHLRREAKVVKPDCAEVPLGGTSPSRATEEEVAVEILKQSLLKLIAGRDDEKELEEFILAASMTTAEGKVNQQLAELLRVEVREVINRRDRLLRVARVKELHEEHRNGRKTDKSIH
jgi:DNA-directed RNA polymerase specialized sigma24 family protein